MLIDIADPDFEAFSLQNPPDSIEIAHARLAYVEVDIEHVRAQLEFRNPDDFETDDDYFEWKGRAMSAYAHKRREISFLERWINTQELLALVLKTNKADSPISGIVSVVERVRAQLHAEYQIVYTNNIEPPDLVSAQRRKNYIDILIQKYKGVAQALTMLLDMCRVGEKERGRLVVKLVSAVVEMEKESQVLRKSLRKQRSTAVENLLSALKRSMAEGFVLTAEESNSMSQMLGYRAELKEDE